MSRRRNKQQPLIILAAFIIIVLGTISLNSPSAATTSNHILLAVLIGGTGLGLVVLTLVYWHESRKLQALRALQAADIHSMTGTTFERYVGALLRSQGFKVKYTKSSGDLGVDIVARKKSTSIAVQVKRYQKTIGQDAIRQAVAGMAYYRCKQSMVVTNSRFTASAKLLAASNRCELIDGFKLGEWIVAFQKNEK